MIPDDTVFVLVGDQVECEEFRDGHGLDVDAPIATNVPKFQEAMRDNPGATVILVPGWSRMESLANQAFLHSCMIAEGMGV